ncbi:MAG TPA: TetR/AcrR family transcriptional regulator [Labilithrix sp.]|nr:TetR/AcrR family transcriptional regulator [Labilithrix sp.]
MGRPREVTDEQIVIAARRCFLQRGAGVSAADIAKELGVSHTTLFNRFGSKEGLMLAALGPPTEKIAWVAALEEGPDDRPIREQLVEHAKVMSTFYEELQAGFGILQAAGIDVAKAHKAQKKGKNVSGPQQAYVALVGWLERAQSQRRLGKCDVHALASTLLGALHGWALTARVCGLPASNAAAKDYVERLVELLWNGVGDGT